MLSRVPRELLERMAAMRSEAPQEGLGRILSLSTILLGLWIGREVLALWREGLTEIVWPAWALLRAVTGF